MMRFFAISCVWFAALTCCCLSQAGVNTVSSQIYHALVEDKIKSAAAISALRLRGPQALDALFQARDRVEMRLNESPNKNLQTRLAGLNRVIDQVGGQLYSSRSRLFWYTDLEAAKAAAQESGNPILSLRMLGKLTDEYSCANSRYFRTTLYSNQEIANILREKFVLHWKSVRPVPRITIDFGDGRKIERTITGNSAHYVLSQDGTPLDVLPGLYGTTAFQQWLADAQQLANTYQSTGNNRRDFVLASYHNDALRRIAVNWSRDLARVAREVRKERANVLPPSAPVAARVAVTKAGVEIPMLAAYLEDATTEETWKQIAALSGVDSIPSPSVTARRILTVEDDAAIRRGIVDALTFAGFDVLEAGNGKEGWKRALRHSYDLLLLDLVLPGPSGLEILTEVRRVRPTQPVILLTAKGEEDDRVEGLRLGADDYVVKPFSVKELLARVEAVLRRSPERPTDVQEIAIPGGVADIQRREIRFNDGNRTELSEREMELLRYLATNPGRAIARDEILANVWRISPRGVPTRTIDMHIARLREKLCDDSDDPQVLLTVRGKGYMFANQMMNSEKSQ